MSKIKELKAVIDRLRAIAADGKLAIREKETLEMVILELERTLEELEGESRTRRNRLLVEAVARASWFVLARYLNCLHKDV